MSSDLSPLQQRVYSVFQDAPDTDVPIDTMYAVAYPEEPIGRRSLREKQQRLGSAITRINSKLNEGNIAPGEARRTYRLYTSKA